MRSDAELAVEAAAGSSVAFEALYRRHSESAWRVAYAVTGNRDDASDAVAEAFTRVFQALPAGRLSDASLVRSYLLTATRNAAIDGARRGGRVRSTDQLDQLDDRTKVSSPTDRVTDNEDVSFVAAAFRSLPERWRSVLWLTEVEGIPPKEAAALLGVSANNVAQLAVRARASLRERFVQAHLSGAVPSECRETVDRLGAYVTGRLSPRYVAKVDQHLAGCADCRQRSEELEDVGGSLRRIIVPLPLLLGPATLTKWKLASSSGAAAAEAATSPLVGTQRLVDVAARLQKPLLATATGIFAVAVIVAAPNVVGGAGEGGAPRGVDRVPIIANAQPPAPSTVVPRTIQLVSVSPALAEGLTEAVAPTSAIKATLPPPQPELPAPPVASEPPSSAAPDAGTGADPAPPSGDADPASDGVVAVGVAAVAGPVTGGLIVGDACQGGYVMDESAGTCSAPAAESSTLGVTLVTGGSTPIAGHTHTLGI